MIVVDSSVWVAHFRNQDSPQVVKLRNPAIANDVIVGDLVLLECLQGARDDSHAGKIEAALRTFRLERMLDDNLAAQAAKGYRRLRSIGVTPRKTIDVIIGVYCIANGHHLLHQDSDFDAMETHLGLRVL